LEATVQRLKEVKSVGIDVGLDFHGRVHKTLAKQLAAALEPHKPLFIEEPLLPGQVPEMKELYRKTNIPIAVSLKGILDSGSNSPINRSSSASDSLLGKM
jgi:galactonate dehydratase